MLIRMAEPALLGPGLDWGCELSVSAFTAVELVVLEAAVLEPAVLEPVFEVAELVGPPFSVWAGAPAGPVLSALICALAGRASITAKRGAITRLRKCLGEGSKHMSCPLLRRDEPVHIV